MTKTLISRRIRYFRSQYHFKLRFCKRCENLFRFKVTGYQRNAYICSKYRKPTYKQNALNIKLYFRSGNITLLERVHYTEKLRKRLNKRIDAGIIVDFDVF